MTQEIKMRDYSIPSTPYIDRTSRRDWVSFGDRNDYPQMLLELVESSPIQSSILANRYTYCMGAGLKPYDSTKVFTPNLQYGWDELISRCMYDFVYLEAFAIQIIPNNEDGKYSFYHTPVRQVRCGQYDENNNIKEYFLCNDWRKAIKSKNVVTIKAWGSETPKKGERYLAYFKKYKPNEDYYAVPQYCSALNWIMADHAVSVYYNNFINNNFSANLAITYPMELDKDKEDALYENLQRCFGGSKNAGNILLLFGEDGSLPDVKSIQATNADLYDSVSNKILYNLVSANRLTSPTLGGIATASGFSSKADELIASITLYNLTVIKEIRAFVLDKINLMLQINGYDRCLMLDDYNLQAEFNGNVAENDEKEQNNVDVETEEE